MRTPGLDPHILAIIQNNAGILERLTDTYAYKLLNAKDWVVHDYPIAVQWMRCLVLRSMSLWRRLRHANRRNILSMFQGSCLGMAM